jgi:hypothetical protein
MSVLAIILMAAMAAPGDGAEKVSGDLVEQGLSLRGKWRGSYRLSRSFAFDVAVTRDSVLLLNGENVCVSRRLHLVDEGNGRLRWSESVDGLRLGIYKWENDRLFISLGLPGTGQRPISFDYGEGKRLLILHRVNSRK